MTFVYRLRKLISFCAIAALLISAFSVMAVTAVDVNGDDDVTAADARLLLLSLVDLVDMSEGHRISADLNGDGDFDSSDVRALLLGLVQDTTTTSATEPISTRPTVSTVTSTSVTTTRSTVTTLPPDFTTNTTTTTTMYTTTTTWMLTGPDGTAPTTYPTTTDTTVPDCVSTYTTTTVPTTLPYGPITVSVGDVSAHGGDTITVPIKISRDHALVGFEMNIYSDWWIRLKEVTTDARNLYATNLNPAVFNDDAQWRFTKSRNGSQLNIRYVSAATNGPLDSGTLFYLTFEVGHVIRDTDATIDCELLSYISCANGMEYVPVADTVSGTVHVTPGTTLYPTTTTTGRGGPTTTTTLPYGGPLYLTGDIVMARVGDTFDWTVSVSQFHYLVGMEVTVNYDPSVLTLLMPTSYNDGVFGDHAQWRFSHVGDGTVTLRYVSSAQTGDTASGELFTLSFLLNYDTPVDIDESPVRLSMPSYLSAAFGIEFQPTSVVITDGLVKVASRTTRPPTNTTATVADTTYPPTTTTFVYAG